MFIEVVQLFIFLYDMDIKAIFGLVCGFLTASLIRYNPKVFLFLFFVYVPHDGYGQCVATFTDLSPKNPVCSFQWLLYPAGGKIKINLSPLTIYNRYLFTTVGESTEDTNLSLYDSLGTLLASNDDASDCLGCKQSTILFNATGLYTGAYLILSKSGCEDLDTGNIRFNVTNDYDFAPEIIEPETPFYPCKGKTFDLDTSANSLPVNAWSSSDPGVATINSDTGVVTFIKSGTVKIKLIGNFSCETIKTYHVIATETSFITHD